MTIAICGINYISKTKYRSSVLVEYAPSISIGPYVEAFMSESPEERKAAVKALVGEVEKRMRSVTLDAEDWETLWSAEVARQVLWEDEKRLPLRYYRDTVKRCVHPQAALLLCHLLIWPRSPAWWDSSPALASRPTLDSWTSRPS